MFLSSFLLVFMIDSFLTFCFCSSSVLFRFLRISAVGVVLSVFDLFFVVCFGLINCCFVWCCCFFFFRWFALVDLIDFLCFLGFCFFGLEKDL